MSDVEDRLVVRMEATLTRFENQMRRAYGVVDTTAGGIERRTDSMNRRIVQNAEAAAESMTRAQQRIAESTGLSRSTTSAEASGEAFRKAFDMQSGIDRLQASMDPLHAAMLRHRAAVDAVSAAVASGAITQAQANRVLDLAKGEYDQAALAARRLTVAEVAGAAGTGRLINVSSAGRAVLQNTAAQLGDIAVQLEMGTSPARVMAQQLPQLFGGFGMLGGALGVVAPLLSVVAAVGIPVAAMLLTMGDEAENTKEKVKSFADKLQEANAALSRAREAAQLAGAGGLDQLREKYGQVTIAVVELAEKLADIERRAAKVKLDLVFDDTFGQAFSDQINRLYGTVGEALTGGFKDQIPELERQIAAAEADIANRRKMNVFVSPAELAEIARMREELAAARGDVENIGSLAAQVQVSPELLAQLSEARDRLDEARQAADFSGVADAIRTIRQVLEASGQVLDQAVVDKLAQAEDAARQAAGALNDGEAAAAGLAGAADGAAGAIAGAAGEAARLAGNLRAAAGALAAIASGISSLDISNIGDRARVAALQEGKSRAQANVVGRLAEERARLAPALGSADGAIRADAAAQLAKLEAGLQESAALEERLNALMKSTGGGSKGRSGRSRGEWDVGQAEIDQLRQRIELIGRDRSEVVELEAKYRLLTEAKRRNLDLDKVQAGSSETLRQQIERQAEEIGRLTAQYDQAQERARFFDQAQADLKEGFLDAIIEGKSLSGVLEDLAKSFARAALEAALFNSGPFASGGGGGGLLGSLFSGLFGARASGGGVVGGQPYRINENTPNSEIFVPSKSGAVLTTQQAQNALRGGRVGAMAVSIGWDETIGNFRATVRDEAGRVVAQAAPQIVSQSVSATYRRAREVPLP